MKTDALLSEDRVYRYWLLRRWDEALPLLCIIGLNPSTADEKADDNTIRKEIGFAKRDGYGGILKLNLYSYRATEPKEMWKAEKRGVDIIGGPRGRVDVLQAYAQEFGCAVTIAAWGRHGEKRGPLVIHQWPGLLCFGCNVDGTPKHPLYLKADTPLSDLRAALGKKD